MVNGGEEVQLCYGFTGLGRSLIGLGYLILLYWACDRDICIGGVTFLQKINNVQYIIEYRNKLKKFNIKT